MRDVLKTHLTRGHFKTLWLLLPKRKIKLVFDRQFMLAEVLKCPLWPAGTNRFDPHYRAIEETEMVRAAGNYNSASGDSFGSSSYSPASPSVTLADLLRAAVDGKVDPEAVFNALPKNLHSMFDDLARRAGGRGFLGTPTETQQALFVAFLEAISQAKQTTPSSQSASITASPSAIVSKPQASTGPPPASPQPSLPAAVKKSAAHVVKEPQRDAVPQSTKTPSAKRPWWKFW